MLFAGVVVIETTLHPIENTFKMIGEGIDYLVNDIDWIAVGDNISSWWIDTFHMSKSKGPGNEIGWLGKSNEFLEKLLGEARRDRDTELIKLLEKELKQPNRNKRNKRKKRGGPRMRGLWWLALPEIIRKILGNDGN